MPKNKDALSRYRIIDQYLRNTPYGKTSRIAEVCSDKLGIPVSRRTIQKDIKDMIEDTVLNMYAPIKYNTKEKAYYYPDDVDEIFPALELSDEEISVYYSTAKFKANTNNLGFLRK